ncbi:MAG: LacI family DNA-binding transcriptional regulator [Phycisphaerae bacterium]|nr:LacI family DNA-binding transcriptional regulator [Phycisphaerae bacterium]
MGVTLKDIGEQVGVSPMTVSAALRNAGGVSDETRDRVLQTARKMGYRANAFARGMRSGSFGSIAVVLSAHPGRSYLPQAALRGICEVLRERELQLSVAELPDEKLTDAGFVPRLLREYCCDGMLVDYTDWVPDKVIDLIESLRQPVIWLNRKQDHDCVYPDDVATGRQATQRLLSAGHRRIAYLDWGAGWKQLDQAHYSQRDRQAGYEQTMRDAGLTPEPIRRDDSDVPTSEQALREAVSAALIADDRPTAFVTYSWPFARRVAAVATAMGLRVPNDLSLVNTGSDDQVELDDGSIVTTVVTPERQYGAAGVEAVLEKLDAPPGSRLAPRAVGPAGIIGGCTVAPPAPRRPTGQEHFGADAGTRAPGQREMTWKGSWMARRERMT